MQSVHRQYLTTESMLREVEILLKFGKSFLRNHDVVGGM